MSAPRVLLQTSMGDITLELDQERAPISVANFLSYVDAGHYDGTIFHRVIANFMIQGGGFTADMKQKPTQPAIVNESTNGLLNEHYTVAMARTSVPNSATCQFFINTVNNEFLNRRSSQDGVGYAVFGKVVAGSEVVEKIRAVPTGMAAGMKDVPTQTVTITSARRV